MSMISRQKLIEELETEYEGYKNLYCKTFDSEYRGRMDGIDIAIKVVDDQPPADQCVPLSEIYRVIAGHSDYHGDDVLASLTCIAEGKEVKPVRPLPADQWIPCDIAVPPEPVGEYYKDVQIKKRSGEVVIGYYRNDDGEWWGIKGDDANRMLDAVEWRPLPEPYKGE